MLAAKGWKSTLDPPDPPWRTGTPQAGTNTQTWDCLHHPHSSSQNWVFSGVTALPRILVKDVQWVHNRCHSGLRTPAAWQYDRSTCEANKANKANGNWVVNWNLDAENRTCGNPQLMAISSFKRLAVTDNHFLRVTPASSHSIWHIFWHSVWHSIWHLIWHSVWQSIWHFISHILGASFWHFIWHFIWHIFCHSIWHLLWHSTGIVLAFNLASILAFPLASFLASMLTFYLFRSVRAHADLKLAVSFHEITSLLAIWLDAHSDHKLAQGRTAEEGKEGRRATPVIKARGAHLAGAELLSSSWAHSCWVCSVQGDAGNGWANSCCDPRSQPAKQIHGQSGLGL